MDAIREYLEKPVFAGAAGLVIGLVLGILYAWVINPVEWTDASISHLRDDLKEQYLRMAIDSYNLTFDTTAAQQHWEALGSGAPEILAEIEASPDPQGTAAIASYRAAVETEPVAEAEEEEGGVSPTLLVICLIAVVVVGGVAAYYLFRQGRLGPPSPATQAQEATREAERTDFAVRDEGAPMSQFMTTYMLGDDLFDDSFSIDSPSGEFLGECGVGISEAIGVGDPKRVAAFEVWLFDKNDIQTVTQVLMSEHAFSDDEFRQRLAAKGEPFLAEPGAETVLETATLRLNARVVDMAYGSGTLPVESFFERLTLELAVWQKS
jgi:hypothetical protein